MDYPCTWDRQRREGARRTLLAEPSDSEWAKASREQHEAERFEIRQWLAGQVNVTAKRTSSYAPEQWEGTVDGHSFAFASGTASGVSSWTCIRPGGSPSASPVWTSRGGPSPSRWS